MVRLGLLLPTLVLVPGALLAQLTTGAIEGTLRATDGRPMPGAPILITGGAGFRTVIHSNSNGDFAMMLPYGRYSLSGGVQNGSESSGATVLVAPLQTTRFDLVVNASGSIRGVQPAARAPGIWTDATSGRQYPEAFSLPGLLLSREPSSVTEPLDFTGLRDNRLAVESQGGFSWTYTQYKFQAWMQPTPTSRDFRRSCPTFRRSMRSRCAAPSLRQLRRVMAQRLAFFLPSRAYPGTARFPQQAQVPRFLRRTCRRQRAGDWCNRPTDFAGSREIVWKSADR